MIVEEFGKKWKKVDEMAKTKIMPKLRYINYTKKIKTKQNYIE